MNTSLIWLGRVVVLIIGLALLGAIYETLAEAADVKTYPPPGQLVDVGGHRLHIHCTGTGSPTVIIVAGLGDWSTTWDGVVQPEVAKTTRVCTYDRPGFGWSDAIPLPQDAAQSAKELHTLLQNANIPEPYIMVGHSLGGFIVRLFAHDYASEVSGVVLIDSMNPKQVTQPPSPSNSQSKPFSFQAALARFGIARLLVKVPGIAPSVPASEAAYYPLYIRPQSLQATDNELQTLPSSAAETASVKSFGDLPLIVLTARRNDIPGWPEWQTELLQLSSNSQHLFAENSGHNIQADEPQAAVAAIIQMVQQVRETAARQIPMVRKITLLSTMLFVLISSGFQVSRSFADARLTDFEEVDAYITIEMKELGIPGAALVIVQGDQIVHLKGFGVADASGRLVTPQTPFFTGSTGKSFTALAIMQLVEAGKIQLDAPVQAYLPWFRVADPNASEIITVRQLLNQVSGLPKSIGQEQLANTDQSDSAIKNNVRALAKVELSSPPGEHYEYSNANYNTLGMIIQAVTGQSYESYIEVAKRLHSNHAEYAGEVGQDVTNSDEINIEGERHTHVE